MLSQEKKWNEETIQLIEYNKEKKLLIKKPSLKLNLMQRIRKMDFYQTNLFCVIIHFLYSVKWISKNN